MGDFQVVSCKNLPSESSEEQNKPFWLYKQGGVQRKVSHRSVRKLIRARRELRTKYGHTTVKSTVKRSGLSFEMASRRTFSRYLNENGNGYLQARKKGLLSENDGKLRIRFARKMKRVVAQILHA